MKLARLVSLSLVLAVYPALVHAAPSPPAEKNPMLAEARAAFAEGRGLMAEGHYREAITKFQQAAQVKETPGLRYYIAYCHEQLEELVEAKGEYERASELLKDFDAGDVKELLPEARARVDRAIASLFIEGTAPGTLVQLDGNVVTTGVPIAVNPGHHEVTVEVPGGERRTTSVEIARGEARRLVPEAPPSTTSTEPLVQKAPAPAESTAKDGARSSAKPILVWSSIGVAAVGAGVLSAGIALRESNANQATDLLPLDCSTPSDECTAYANAVDAAHTGETLAIAGGIGFGVGVTSALLFHFLWPNQKAEKVEAYFGPESGGFRFTRSF